ncbi:MAG: hypothetical protein WC918_06555 [Bacteroidales bacterium]
MDKTTINKYTEQMREQYQHLVSSKPSISTGLRFYLDATQQNGVNWYGQLQKWIADFREIYDFISDEVNKGGTSFESNTFIQEATKLIDKYNREGTEVSVIRDRKQKGNKTDLYEFFAWNYTIAFCDYIKDAFTPLIDNCRKDVSAQEPKARPRRPKGEPILKQDIKTLKDSFKDKVWFDTFLKSKLEAKSNKKRLAAIAYVIYEGKYLNKLPGTFTEWHTTFCRLLGCTAGQYYPNDIKDFQEYNALSKEFEKSTSDKHK